MRKTIYNVYLGDFSEAREAHGAFAENQIGEFMKGLEGVTFAGMGYNTPTGSSKTRCYHIEPEGVTLIHQTTSDGYRVFIELFGDSEGINSFESRIIEAKATYEKSLGNFWNRYLEAKNWCSQPEVARQLRKDARRVREIAPDYPSAGTGF